MCAAPWPPPQRRLPGQSERHRALAPLHAVEVDGFEDPPPLGRLRAAPTAPPDTMRASQGGSEPWAPAWSPDTPPVVAAAARAFPESSSVAPSPGCRLGSVAEDAEYSLFSTAAAVAAAPPLSLRPSLVGGPREALPAQILPSVILSQHSVPAIGSTREGSFSSLPAGVQDADFDTLQQMIARSFEEAERGALTLEGGSSARAASLQDLESDGAHAVTRSEEQALRASEARLRRVEDETEKRQRERREVRQKRQQEDEERRRLEEEELEREEREQQRLRLEKSALEEQCQREFAAASRIQARARGRRSRAGKLSESLPVVGQVHPVPWRNSVGERSAIPSGFGKGVGGVSPAAIAENAANVGRPNSYEPCASPELLG